MSSCTQTSKTHIFECCFCRQHLGHQTHPHPEQRIRTGCITTIDGFSCITWKLPMTEQGRSNLILLAVSFSFFAYSRAMGWNMLKRT